MSVELPSRRTAMAVSLLSLAMLTPAFAGSLDADLVDRLGAAQSARLQVLSTLDTQQLQESLRALESLKSLKSLESLKAFGALSAYDSFDGFDTSDDSPGTIGSNQPIDEHRPLNADGRLRISNVAGSVDVSAWNKNEVAVTGELGAGSEKLDISGDASNLAVVVKLPRKSHNVADSELRLRVPIGAHVEIETVSADVSAHDLAGPVKVNTVSGDVSLQLASPEVSVQTVSGDLTLHAPSHQTRVNTVSGDLNLSGLQDRLSAETVSGDLELDGGRFSDLHLKSISGDMRVAVSFAQDAQVNGETLSGNITLSVPAGLSGSALLKSFSGDTLFEGAQTVASSKKHEFVFGNGNGGVHFELSSFSGDIRVEKK